MKNFKEKFKKIENWNGWKWFYYMLVFIIAGLIMTDFCEMISALTDTNEERILAGRIPIPAECCWEFRSKTNVVIYCLLHSLVNVVTLLFSRNISRYLVKIIVIISPLVIAVFHTLFFVNL